MYILSKLLIVQFLFWKRVKGGVRKEKGSYRYKNVYIWGGDGSNKY